MKIVVCKTPRILAASLQIVFRYKKDGRIKNYPRLLMQSGVNIKCDDYLYLPFWIFFINCRFDISPVLTFHESSCSSFQLL